MPAEDSETNPNGSKTCVDVLRALAARVAEADPSRKTLLNDLLMSTFRSLSPDEQLEVIGSGVLEMAAGADSPAGPAKPETPTNRSSRNRDTTSSGASHRDRAPAADAPSRPSNGTTTTALNEAAAPFIPSQTSAMPSSTFQVSSGSRRSEDMRSAESPPSARPRREGRGRVSATTASADTAEPIVPTKSIVLDPRAFRTITCPFYARGTLCPNDKRCMYAHGSSQMRTREENEADGITTLAAIDAYLHQHADDEVYHNSPSPHAHGRLALHNAGIGGINAAGSNGGSSANERNTVASRFRTQLCKSYESGCRRGAACPFAHGPDQLRTKQQNVKDGLVSDDAVRSYIQTGELPSQICFSSMSEAASDGVTNTTTTTTTNTNTTVSGISKRHQNALIEAEQREATKEYTIATAFRTQLCPYATSSHCPRGDKCQRAHGAEQLRTHQQNIDEGITTFAAANYYKDHGCPPPGFTSSGPPQPQVVTEMAKPSTFRTRVCSYYGPGKCCKHGDWCVYAHGDAHMRTEEQNIAEGITTLEAISAYLRRQAPSTVTPQDTRESFVASCLRIQVCPNFKKGSCELGNKCRRAHDKDQLRTREQNIADGIVTREAVEFFLEYGYPAPPGTDLSSIVTPPSAITSPTITSPTAYFMMAPLMSLMPSFDDTSTKAITTLQNMHAHGSISSRQQPRAQRILIAWQQLQELRAAFFDYAGNPVMLAPEAAAARNQAYVGLCHLLSSE